MASSRVAAQARQQTEMPIVTKSQCGKQKPCATTHALCEAFTCARVGQSWWQATVVWSQLLAVLGLFLFISFCIFFFLRLLGGRERVAGPVPQV